jgi:hypothetical protein
VPLMGLQKAKKPPEFAKVPYNGQQQAISFLELINIMESHMQIWRRTIYFDLSFNKSSSVVKLKNKKKKDNY